MADSVVSIFVGPSPVAEIIRSLIESAGIQCMVSVDSAGGEAPSVVHGARVLVRAEDAEDARRMIDEAEPLEADTQEYV